jgi:hypothetical protein
MGRRAAVTGVLALLGGLVAALLELLPQDGRNSRDPEVSVRGLPQDGRKLDMLRIPDPPAYPPGASLVAGCRSVRSAPTNIRVGNVDIGARSSVHLLTIDHQHCTHRHVRLTFQSLIFSQPTMFFSHINQPTVLLAAYFQLKRTS